MNWFKWKKKTAMTKIKFTVYGEPATAGSKSAFTFKDKRTGKIRASMAPASKKTRPWMQQVAGTAKAEYDGPLLRGAISYKMVFYFQRPKSHYRTGKYSDLLKPFCPAWNTKKPDALKLARAVEDALTGIVWKDDSQCCNCQQIKHYTMEKSRVEIEIYPLEGWNEL